MPNILNGFTPSVYTPTTVNAPIEQMAGVFKNWNDRYLQGQQQTDKIGEMLSNVDVSNVDQEHLQRVGDVVRSQISGGDYAMMQPGIRSAYKALTQDPALNTAIKQKANMAVQEDDIQKQYMRGEITSRMRDSYMNDIRSYKGVGHNAPIDPNVVGGPSAYVQGADQYGHYDLTKAPTTVKYADLEKASQELMQGYTGGDAIKHAAQTLSNIKQGLTGSKTINTKSTTNISGDEAAKIVSDGLSREPATSEYINELVRMNYKDVGKPMPTGQELANERAKIITKYATETRNKKNQNITETSSSVNTSYIGEAEKDKTAILPVTIPAIPHDNQMPLINKLITDKTGVLGKFMTAGLEAQRSAQGGITSMKIGPVTPREKKDAIIKMITTDMTTKELDSYRDQIYNIVGKENYSKYVNTDGSIKVNTDDNVNNLISVNNKIRISYEDKPQDSTIAPTLYIPVAGKQKRSFDMWNTMLKSAPTNALSVMDINTGQTYTGAEYAKAFGHNPEFEMGGIGSVGNNWKEVGKDKGYGPGLTVVDKSAKAGTNNVFAFKVDKTMMDNDPVMKELYIKNDLADVIKYPSSFRSKSFEPAIVPLYKDGKVITKDGKVVGEQINAKIYREKGPNGEYLEIRDQHGNVWGTGFTPNEAGINDAYDSYMNTLNKY